MNPPNRISMNSSDSVNQKTRNWVLFRYLTNPQLDQNEDLSLATTNHSNHSRDFSARILWLLSNQSSKIILQKSSPKSTRELNFSMRGCKILFSEHLSNTPETWKQLHKCCHISRITSNENMIGFWSILSINFHKQCTNSCL